MRPILPTDEVSELPASVSSVAAVCASAAWLVARRTNPQAVTPRLQIFDARYFLI